MSRDRCGSCRFWLGVPKAGLDCPVDGPGWGWCRREPPKLSEHMARVTIPLPGYGHGPSCPEHAATVDNVGDACIFPATYYATWCGRFEPHPDDSWSEHRMVPAAEGSAS